MDKEQMQKAAAQWLAGRRLQKRALFGDVSPEGSVLYINTPEGQAAEKRKADAFEQNKIDRKYDAELTDLMARGRQLMPASVDSDKYEIPTYKNVDELWTGQQDSDRQIDLNTAGAMEYPAGSADRLAAEQRIANWQEWKSHALRKHLFQINNAEWSPNSNAYFRGLANSQTFGLADGLQDTQNKYDALYAMRDAEYLRKGMEAKAQELTDKNNAVDIQAWNDKQPGLIQRFQTNTQQANLAGAVGELTGDIAGIFIPIPGGKALKGAHLVGRAAQAAKAVKGIKGLVPVAKVMVPAAKTVNKSLQATLKAAQGANAVKAVNDAGNIAVQYLSPENAGKWNAVHQQVEDIANITPLLAGVSAGTWQAFAPLAAAVSNGGRLARLGTGAARIAATDVAAGSVAAGEPSSMTLDLLNHATLRTPFTERAQLYNENAAETAKRDADPELYDQNMITNARFNAEQATHDFLRKNGIDPLDPKNADVVQQQIDKLVVENGVSSYAKRGILPQTVLDSPEWEKAEPAVKLGIQNDFARARGTLRVQHKNWTAIPSAVAAQGQSDISNLKDMLDAKTGDPEVRRVLYNALPGLTVDTIRSTKQGAAAGTDSLQMFNTIVTSMSDKELRTYSTKVADKVTAQDLQNIARTMTGSSTNKKSPGALALDDRTKTFLIDATIDKLRKSPSEAIPVIDTQLDQQSKSSTDSGSMSQTQQQMQGVADIMLNDHAYDKLSDDRFIGFCTKLSDMQAAMGSDSPEFKKIMEKVPARQKQEAFNRMKADPTQIHKYAAQWIRSKGHKDLASAIENPVVFYGGLATLLIGGTVLQSSLLSGKDDDEDEDDDDIEELDDDAAYRKRIHKQYGRS